MIPFASSNLDLLTNFSGRCKKKVENKVDNKNIRKTSLNAFHVFFHSSFICFSPPSPSPFVPRSSLLVIFVKFLSRNSYNLKTFNIHSALSLGSAFDFIAYFVLYFFNSLWMILSWTRVILGSINENFMDFSLSHKFWNFQNFSCFPTSSKWAIMKRLKICSKHHRCYSSKTRHTLRT